MEQLSQSLFSIISNPFVLGLSLGLVLVLMVSFKGWVSRRNLIKEHQIFRDHLNAHVTIQGKGSQELLRELDEVKKQNENLRNTVAILKNKPSREDLRVLHIYDQTIRRMNLRAPGFAPVWELTLLEVETEFRQIDSGVIGWIHRMIRPSLSKPHASINSLSAGVNNQPAEVMKRGE